MRAEKSKKDTQSPGTTSAARDSALLSLRRVYATTRRQLAALRRTTGLGSALVWALAEIEEQRGLRVGDLAERMRIHSSTASNLCTRLRSDGLVRTSPAAADGRALCIYLTAEGRATLRKAPGPQRGVLKVALSRMTAAECRVLVAALSPLLRELGSVYGVGDGFQPID
jgi:DNA-binding MarR family transcriptional regulator